MQTITTKQTDTLLSGVYNIIVYYLDGSCSVGDEFVVNADELSLHKLSKLARIIQDIADQQQFSILVNGNVTGINLSNVTHVVLNREDDPVPF